MKILNPIFPTETDLAKRGNNVKSQADNVLELKCNSKLTFLILEVGDGSKTSDTI